MAHYGWPDYVVTPYSEGPNATNIEDRLNMRILDLERRLRELEEHVIIKQDAPDRELRNILFDL